MKGVEEYEAPIGMGLFIIPVGDWRSYRPVVNRDKCCKCGTCWLFCPTQCIKVSETYCEADLQFCKGCGICAYECPSHVITMVEEVREIS